MPQYKKRQYKRKAPVKKRGFYFDATIGRNVPIIGGTGLRIGTRALKSVVKRELLKQEETKVVTNPLPRQDFLHNTIYTYAPLLKAPVQGTAVDQRTGDQILLQNVVMRFNMINKPTKPFVKLRVLGVWMEKETFPVSATTGAQIGQGIGSNEVFLPSESGVLYSLIDNKKEHNVICDKTFTLSTAFSSQVKSSSHTVSCPINKVVTYKSNVAPMYLKDKQLYFLFVSDAPLSGGGDGTMSIDGTVLVTYKDI